MNTDNVNKVNQFLLELAKRANPDRFYPFPDIFRESVQQVIKDKKLDINSIEDQQRAIDIALDLHKNKKTSVSLINNENINSHINNTKSTNSTKLTDPSQPVSSIKTFNSVNSTSSSNTISDHTPTDSDIVKVLNRQFPKYTPVEYKFMYEVLSKIPDKFDYNTLNSLQKAIINCICNTPIKIAFHSESVSGISEYEFKYNNKKERILNMQYKKRWYLFHGSPPSNWYSILHNGIKNMSCTEFMSTGAAIGNGVYLSSNIQISRGYGYDNKYSYIAVVEILEDCDKYKKGNEIYVIPNDKILIPRYLLKISNHYTGTGEDVLEYYTKLKNSYLKSTLSENIINNRIKKEIAQLTKHFTIVDQLNDCYTILLSNGILIEMYLDNYPFQSVIFRLKYKLNAHNDNFDDKSGLYNYPEELENWSPMITLESLIIQLIYNLKSFYMTEEEIPFTLEYDVTL